MKVAPSHIEINVANSKISFPFYKKLLDYLGFKIIHEEKTFIGFYNGNFSIWIGQSIDKYKKNKFHRKNPGLNHIAFNVSSKKRVNQFTKEFLEKNKVKTLYESPKAFPEYSKNYYAVYFEDPDRIKLEIEYH